jgi:hypothetical protein
VFPDCSADLVDPCTLGGLDCSESCPAPLTCGGAGTENECGCPPTVESQVGYPHAAANDLTQPSDARWVRNGEAQSQNMSLAEALQQQDNARAITAEPLPEGRWTHRLLTTDFRFSIPSDATVVGIRLTVEKSVGYQNANQPNVRDTIVRLHYGDDTVAPLNPIDQSPWPNVDEEFRYGGETDTWGMDWTPEQINDVGFGARIRAQVYAPPSGTATPRIDWVQIEVFYQPACEWPDP